MAINCGLLKVTKELHLVNLIKSDDKERIGSWWGSRGCLGNPAKEVDRPVVAARLT